MRQEEPSPKKEPAMTMRAPVGRPCRLQHIFDERHRRKAVPAASRQHERARGEEPIRPAPWGVANCGGFHTEGQRGARWAEAR